MVGPNTNKRRFWSEDENRNLIIGVNRYYESSKMYRDIETDPELGFEGNRRSVEIKDRLRLFFEDLDVYHSFFVPSNARNKLLYIPEEYIGIVENPTFEPPIPLLPENQRVRLSRICFMYSSTIKRFKEELALLPTNLSDDPVKDVITWDQLCRKSFTGRCKLKSAKKSELLTRLVENGHLFYKKVGIRTYVYKPTNANA